MLGPSHWASCPPGRLSWGRGRGGGGPGASSCGGWSLGRLVGKCDILCVGVGECVGVGVCVGVSVCVYIHVVACTCMLHTMPVAIPEYMYMYS